LKEIKGMGCDRWDVRAPTLGDGRETVISPGRRWLSVQADSAICL
jgi:hypothetical protein